MPPAARTRPKPRLPKAAAAARRALPPLPLPPPASASPRLALLSTSPRLACHSNWLDWLRFVSVIAAAGQWVTLLLDTTRNLDLDTTEYVDLDRLASLVQTHAFLSCVAVFINVFASFKCFRANEKMGSITRCIAEAGWDMGAFFIVFLTSFGALHGRRGLRRAAPHPFAHPPRSAISPRSPRSRAPREWRDSRIRLYRPHAVRPFAAGVVDVKRRSADDLYDVLGRVHIGRLEPGLRGPD